MPEIETGRDIAKQGEAKFWLDAIRERHKQLKEWHDRAWTVLERYRDEKSSGNRSRFNILYSNTRVLKPALYARQPIPDVRRRFRDADPLGKAVAEVVERSLIYSMDRYDFDDTMQAVTQDFALPGLGIAVVGYEPVFGDEIVPRVPVEPTIGEDGSSVYPDDAEIEDGQAFTMGEPFQPVIDERFTCEYWFWEDFCWGAARKWNDVPWEAFRSRMTREELAEISPEKASLVDLDWTPPRKKGQKGEKERDEYKRATVWKIWDKKQRRVLYVAEGLPNDVLKTEPDPLGLEGFFPNPRPVIAISTNDTMLPIPLYCMYQDQAQELDDVNERIRRLTKKLQAKGFYNQAHKHAMSLLDEAEDGALIPMAVHGADTVNMNNMVAYWPIERIAQVLTGLMQQREQIKQVIYEIIGLSDIVRGSTKASETATAQEIKSNFATIGLDDMRGEIQRFARDMLRIKAEIMAEHFSAETLSRMTGLQVTPEMMQVLRDDKLRSYHIDIETDSTIEPDAQQEQKNFIELITALTKMLTEWAPLVASGVVPLDVAKSVMMAGLRRFKNVRDIEDALEQIGQQQQQQGPSEQDTEMEKLRMEMQAEIAKLQQEGQLEQAKLQQERELKMQEIASDERIAYAKMQQESQSRRELAEISARPATQIQFDTQGAMDGIASSIGAIAQQQQQSGQQQSEALQIMLARLAENESRQNSEIQQGLGQMAQALNTLGQGQQQMAQAILNGNERVVEAVREPRAISIERNDNKVTGAINRPVN